jgi:hypothetical protein
LLTQENPKTTCDQLLPVLTSLHSPVPAMAEFDDRQTQIDAENEPYHQYEYQTEENGSWAGNLPVKQGLYDPNLEKDAWYVLSPEVCDCSKAALATHNST